MRIFFHLPLEEKLLWVCVCWAVCAHPCASSQGCWVLLSLCPPWEGKVWVWSLLVHLWELLNQAFGAQVIINLKGSSKFSILVSIREERWSFKGEKFSLIASVDFLRVWTLLFEPAACGNTCFSQRISHLRAGKGQSWNRFHSNTPVEELCVCRDIASSVRLRESQQSSHWSEMPACGKHLWAF